MQSGPQYAALHIFTGKFLHFLRQSPLFRRKCAFGYSFRYGLTYMLALCFIGGVMSLMSILNSRFSARTLMGGLLLSVACSANADQFTLGRTILLDGGRAAVVPVPMCRMVDAIKGVVSQIDAA